MFKKLIYCIGMCFIGNIYAGLFRNENKKSFLNVHCLYRVNNNKPEIIQLEFGEKKLNCIFEICVNNDDINLLKNSVKTCGSDNVYLLNNGLDALNVLLNKSNLTVNIKSLILKTIETDWVDKDGQIRLEEVGVGLVKNGKIVTFGEFLVVDANAKRHICIVFFYKRNNPNFADNMQNDGNNTHGPIIIPNIMPHDSNNLPTNDDSGQHNHQTLPGKHIPGSVKKGVNYKSNTGGCCGCKTR